MAVKGGGKAQTDVKQNICSVGKGEGKVLAARSAATMPAVPGL